ncbi:antitoxin Xre/MbcA/ParS toxin-binding domain-containing protein [Deinococcus soli (ex Cha et al. 2016)]|nr:antitoxin Xre/MbcA/ParS toxin-binding domain-containing protein [Deinococcus soli (ex Cha et al. 2016)]
MTAKRTREIEVTDTIGVTDAGRLVMTVNGQPIYAAPESNAPVSETDLLRLATLVTDDEDVAEAWMDRPNPGLKNRTPREAVKAGDSQAAAGILRSFIAL